MACTLICLLVAVVCTLVSSTVAANSGFRFANCFGDHMVLQREIEQASKYTFMGLANVWGFVPVMDNVKLSYSGNEGFNEASVICPTDIDECIWSTTLAPYIGPGGPYEVHATSQKYGTISLVDVMFGDVWVCSGQSNMAFELRHAFNATAEIHAAGDYSNIRLFTAAKVESNKTEREFLKIVQPWQVASPEAVNGTGHFSAVCWLFARNMYDRYGIPIGLVASYWGGTPIQDWSSPDALKMCPGNKNSFKRSAPPDHKQPTPSSLWNAMIYPLVRMTIYGVVWYQGEANSHANQSEYACYFHAMITDWRSKWSEGTQGNTRPELPFGFVQLAGDGKDNSTAERFGFPEVRWAQTHNYGYVPNKVLRNVFMAVAIDLGDPQSPYGSIHPRYKEEVGARLARGAAVIGFGNESVYFTGPLPTKAYIIKGDTTMKARIRYTNISTTLEIRSPYGFEVACTAGDTDTWLEGVVSSSTTTAVAVSFPLCPKGSTVKMVRYAWRQQPCSYKKCSVYSGGLPSPPYLIPVEMVGRE